MNDNPVYRIYLRTRSSKNVVFNEGVNFKIEYINTFTIILRIWKKKWLKHTLILVYLM